MFVCLCEQTFVPVAFANTVRLCGRDPCSTLCRFLHYLRVCHVFQVFGEQAQSGLTSWRRLSTVYLRRPGEITRVKLSTRQRMLPAARGVWGRFGSLEPQLTPMQSWETGGLRGAQGGDRRLFRGDRRLFRFGLTVQDGKIGELFRAVARGCPGGRYLRSWGGRAVAGGALQ